MTERLCITVDTLNKYKKVLEDDGYIRTYYGLLNEAKNKRGYNEYELFDYDYRKKNAGYEIFKMRKQEWKEQQKTRKCGGIHGE